MKLYGMKTALLVLLAGIAVVGCQKKDRPGLTNYPEDSNPPGGPLKFYAAFDGTSANKLMNGVDSIKATFPVENPVASVDGVNGKGIQGETGKFVKYSKPNDWATLSESFTISFWEKRDGQTKNGVGGNGPEYPFSFKADGTWSGGNSFLLFEGNNTACAIKFWIYDKTGADSWLTWEGGNSIAGLLDNQWHHIVFVYNSTTSELKLYIDGNQNSHVAKWDGHGKINIDNDKISELRIGNGPGTGYATDDWLSSAWKGSLDQFRFYNVALPEADINDLYVNKK